MIEPKYVTFNQAKMLKEKGFNLPTKWAFDKNGKDYKDDNWDINYNTEPYDNCYSMPEQVLVLRRNRG